MSEEMSHALALAFPAHIQGLLDRGQISLQMASLMSLYDQLADLMERRNLSYVELPPLIASVAASPFYERALCYGRGWYFDSMHTFDDQGELLRDPLRFDRAELFEMVKEGVCPQEKYLLFQPLAWRVGFTVGWLSALSVSQKEDVQAALVLLAALVAPLLIAQPVTKSVTKPASRKQLPAKAKSKLSRKQSKKR